jgi:hypothetical protein
VGNVFYIQTLRQQQPHEGDEDEQVCLLASNSSTRDLSVNFLKVRVTLAYKEGRRMQGVPSKFTLRISAKLIPLVKVFFTRLGIYYMWMCIVFSVREKEVHKHALLLLLIFFLVVGFRSEV